MRGRMRLSRQWPHSARRITPVELEQQLASVPLLAGLSSRIRRRLAETGKRRTYDAEQEIVREGSNGTALYIVLSGEGRVERGGERLGACLLYTSDAADE